MSVRINVEVIKQDSYFEDLRIGDNFVLEPNRTRIYTRLNPDSTFNLYSREINKSANTVDHEGNLYSFSPKDEVRKVDVELKVIIKEGN